MPPTDEPKNPILLYADMKPSLNNDWLNKQTIGNYLISSKGAKPPGEIALHLCFLGALYGSALFT
jgi:hypothetical protein